MATPAAPRREAGRAPVRDTLARALPVLDWLPRYRGAWLPGDLVAGATVWAVVVPQSIAYASVVGVPAEYGLYTALGAAVVFALFTTTRQVFTGPSATVAAVIAPVCGLVAAVGSPHYQATVAALAVVTAAVYVFLGSLRMGWVSNFLASPVLEGFVFAFGLGLVADQLYKVLGVDATAGPYFVKLLGTLGQVPEADPYTLAVGGTAVALLLALRFAAPRLPRAIIVVVLGIAAASLFDLTAYGVAVVGPLPSGLPSFSFPTGLSLQDWATLLVGSLAVVMVGFSESIAAATQMAEKHGADVRTDRELVALGAAQAGSAALGGFPVAGCLSKTAVADGAGQRTQLGLLVVAGLIVLTLLFLTGLFADLPQAVLGAVVIDAALSLIRPRVPARYRALGGRSFGVFLVTGLGLFFVGVVAGIVLGVVLSLGLLISSASRTPVRRLAYDRAEGGYVDAEAHPGAVEDPGVTVLAVRGPLFFADAAAVRRRIVELAGQDAAPVVVLSLGETPDIDGDGADALTAAAEELRRRGKRLVLARVDEGKLDLLRRAGTLDALGEDGVFVTVRAAVRAVDPTTEATPG